MPKILIVDDDRDVIEVCTIVLEAEGYDVVSAGGRIEGLEAARREHPDLMLLDVMMDEDDDGIVLAQDIRRSGIVGPIVMLSNINTVSGMKFGIDNEMLPANEFLEKPVRPDVLVARIRALLEEKKEA